MTQILFLILVCLGGCASKPMQETKPVDERVMIIKKLKWSYEAYKENEKEIICSKATVQGTLSLGPPFAQNEQISTLTKKVGCVALAPVYNNVTHFYEREVVCLSSDKAHKVLAKTMVSCGQGKVTDSQILEVKLKSQGLKLRFFCYL